VDATSLDRKWISANDRQFQLAIIVASTFGPMPPRRLLPLILAASAVLLGFARWFDFQCDDAFIAFRYAENWVKHGQIVYNLGERVEGYTSFTWVLSLAALHWIGVSLPTAAKLLGAVSGVLLVVLTAQFGMRLFSKRLLGTVVLLMLVASNACVAAWTLGGLETPLFAGLVLGSVVGLHDWLDGETHHRAAICALWLSAATLTRPEGGILLLATLVALGIAAGRFRRVPRGLSTFLLGYALVIGGYLLWRRAYYGDFLPNTFYVKTTGSFEALRSRGIAYLGFCAEELGIGFVASTLLLVALPRIGKPSESPGCRASRHAIQAFFLGTLVCVASVGGDFLDLYRFLVPTFPLVFGIAIDRLFELLKTRPIKPNLAWIQPLVLVLLLASYAVHQAVLARRAMQMSEEGRRALGIEPLGWTASYARRWAAMGRWIACHAGAGDVLAVGAAGAMPFYARLPNIDTFGLNDYTVARQGQIIGSRPGHQRFATIDYLLRRSPTFLLISDYATDRPTQFKRDPVWEERGYLWVEAHVLPSVHQAEKEFFHYLLVKHDRAATLRDDPTARVAQPSPFTPAAPRPQ
jgi:arabinofuranosyltransferase